MEEIEKEGFRAVKTEPKSETAPEERALAYTDEFKELVAKNPGFIEKVRGALEKLKTQGQSEVSGNVDVVLLKKSAERTKLDRNYYKVFLSTEDGNHEFFLKVAPTVSDLKNGEKRDRELGYEEFLASAAVKEKLKDIPFVEVVDFQFGYRDKYFTYFVSKWDDNLTVDLEEYIKDLKVRVIKNPDINIGLNMDIDILESKCERIKEALGEEYKNDTDKTLDFRKVNMAYNKKTGKIILFDLASASR